jgi:uncharacterized protein
MENFTPISAVAGGALIGLSAALLLFFNGRIAGISGLLNGAVFAEKAERYWRLCFLLGLVIGAFVFKLSFPDFNVPRQGYPLWLLVIGGFLVGLGARMANGCVSGHGICGIANLSIRSIVATSLFMVVGMVTVYVLRHILGVGV